jgi:hypothetical protein
LLSFEGKEDSIFCCGCYSTKKNSTAAVVSRSSSPHTASQASTSSSLFSSFRLALKHEEGFKQHLKFFVSGSALCWGWQLDFDSNFFFFILICQSLTTAVEGEEGLTESDQQ